MSSSTNKSFNKFIAHIKTTSLQRFLQTVFANKTLLNRFLTVPASYNNHHSQIGGLLEHSLEVAEIIGEHKFKSNRVRELAMVAGFLHDIGKVMTIKSVGQMTNLGLQVPHEPLVLEVCAAGLHQLDKSWKQGADCLRHIWLCSGLNAKYGYPINSTTALIVKHADQLSALRNFEEKVLDINDQKVGVHFHQNQRISKVGPPRMIF